MKCRYRRKTIEKWKAHALIIGAMVTGMIVGAFIRDLAYVNANQELLSPLPKGTPRVETKPVFAVDIVLPTPTPKSTPTSTEEIIEAAFAEFGEEVVRQAKEVARCESGFRWDAVYTNTDGSLDRGLFQINSRWHQIEDPFDPESNARYSANLYRHSGWNLWRSSRHCHGL
jgi:hypothetical protein